MVYRFNEKSPPGMEGFSVCLISIIEVGWKLLRQRYSACFDGFAWVEGLTGCFAPNSVIAIENAGSFDKLRKGSSTAPLAMRPQEAPLRMTLFFSHIESK
jgi:hypothetical protein